MSPTEPLTSTAVEHASSGEHEQDFAFYPDSNLILRVLIDKDSEIMLLRLFVRVYRRPFRIRAQNVFDKNEMANYVDE